MREYENLQDGKGCFLLFMRLVASLLLAGVALGILIGWLVSR